MRRYHLSVALALLSAGCISDRGAEIGTVATTSRVDSIPSAGGYLLVDTEVSGGRARAVVTAQFLEERGTVAFGVAAMDSLVRFAERALADSVVLAPGQSRTMTINAGGLAVTKLSEAAGTAAGPYVPGATWMIGVGGVTAIVSSPLVPRLVSSIRLAAR